MPAKKCNKVRILVMDVLKPHKPNIVEFSQALCEANGILNAEVSVYAIDEKTESVKVVVEGNDLHFETIKDVIEQFGAVIHSVDRCAIGKDPEKLHLQDYEVFRHRIY